MFAQSGLSRKGPNCPTTVQREMRVKGEAIPTGSGDEGVPYASWRMLVDIQTRRLGTIEQLPAFVEGNGIVTF